MGPKYSPVVGLGPGLDVRIGMASVVPIGDIAGDVPGPNEPEAEGANEKPTSGLGLSLVSSRYSCAVRESPRSNVKVECWPTVVADVRRISGNANK